MTDRDRPSTWKPYLEGLCDSCNASCCLLPVEADMKDLIRLQIVSEVESKRSLKKLVKKLISEGHVTSYVEATRGFMLAKKKNGDCVYLNSQTRRCSVYEKRPDTCRDFPSVGPRPGFCPAR